MDISNKTLAVLLVAVMFVSLGGTLISLERMGKAGIAITGRATDTDTGVAQLELTSVTELTNHVPAINWGSGYVDSAYTNCTMDSEGNLGSGCVSFTSQSNGFLLENTGNTNLSVNYTSDKDATTFIGGTNSKFQLKVNENSVEGQSGENSTQDTVASCGGAWTPATYTDITTGGSYLCGSGSSYPLSFEASEDAAVVDIRVVVPEDAPLGQKNATLTFTGTSA